MHKKKKLKKKSTGNVVTKENISNFTISEVEVSILF